MHSSTSNSEPATADAKSATRALAVLLAGLVAYGLALEGASRFAFSRVSRIRGRVERDLREARALRPRGPDGKPTLLFVGNSLLLYGVDRAAFQRRLEPRLDATLFPMENTQYEDWYFGLRTLFAAGARPAFVAAAFTPRQLLSPAVNGEHFARLLMSPGDLLAVRRESGLDNTGASAFFFARYSEWLGSRAQIRSWLLFRLFPGLERAAALFPPPKTPLPPPERVAAEVLPRIRSLDGLCRYYGARLVLVIPPTMTESAGAQEIQKVAASEGLAVLVPARGGELGPEAFSDGFHLNPRGAERFTPQVADALLRAIDPGGPKAPERVASGGDGELP